MRLWPRLYRNVLTVAIFAITVDKIAPTKGKVTFYYVDKCSYKFEMSHFATGINHLQFCN